MSRNTNLNNAKHNINDEFYTRYEDIEEELSKGYEKFLEGKIVYCNCDNPDHSQFWKYFRDNFEKLKLKKLISTYLNIDSENYIYEYDGEKIEKTRMHGNGDFRNSTCIDLLKSADIVITNPPFSQTKAFINFLMEYEKDFLIIAPLNSIANKETFSYIKDNKIWLGYTKPKTFEVPKCENDSKVFEKGGKYYKNFGNIYWFTNLDITKRYERALNSTKVFSEKDYVKYENLDAIDVPKLKDIPTDYYGPMGVPLSFLEHYNPKEFEIIGATCDVNNIPNVRPIGEEWVRRYKENGGTAHITKGMRHLGTKDGKLVFSRIIVRKISKQ